MEAILEEHNSDIETLEARHLQTYQQQDENLKIRLKKRRLTGKERMAQEQEEKAQLREQELQWLMRLR
ncbi:hypothetical protein EB796_016740 [Bugula neritina]|uniref:Uncharacterized protein n=1 Tax=Bugula neritina TaxID=10212 RepID=A0A7J7JF65_BUGNE|nr:hypothetical protein EB796_016740 [Bugula neritina]